MNQLAFCSCLFVLLGGCMTPQQQMDHYIKMVDARPAGQQPPEWQTTRQLIRRPAPGVGEIAPDFSLPTLDDKTTLTRSRFQAGKPLVLIFGSFT